MKEKDWARVPIALIQLLEIPVLSTNFHREFKFFRENDVGTEDYIFSYKGDLYILYRGIESEEDLDNDIWTYRVFRVPLSEVRTWVYAREREKAGLK
jgi:hypothetical protein